MPDEYSLDAPELLLGDSSVLFVLLDLGGDCAGRVLDHFGDRLHVVHDVWVEIDNHKDDALPEGRQAGVAAFLARFPKERARELPYLVETQARNRLRFLRKWDDRRKHAEEDMGETATCYYANHVWDEEEFILLMGDRWGWDLAEEFQLPYFKSNHVIVYLRCNDVITLEEAEAMWLMLGLPDVEGLHRALRRECREQAPK